jgi:hypothetical protein
MIDIWLVASNGLWIAGLSVLLATLSWASWAASLERADGVRLGTVLDRPGLRRAWGLGLVLFCAGMAATGRAWWEWTLWLVVAVASAIYAFRPHAQP